MRWILLLLLLTAGVNKHPAQSHDNVNELYAMNTPSLVSERTPVNKPKFVKEYKYDPNAPKGCVSLHVTSGAGVNQAAAKAAVFNNARAAGGNGLIFFRGKIHINPETNQTIKCTYYATIYKCKNK
jgi:hypothetical protein